MKAIMAEAAVRYRVIWAFFRLSLSDMLVYRVDLFVKVISYPIRLLMTFFFWKALFEAGMIEGYQFEDIFIYYLAMYLLIQMYPFVRMARTIRNDIFSGDILVYVSRGFSHSGMYIGRFLAASFAFLLLTLPLSVLGILLISPSHLSWQGSAGFLLLLVPGIIIKGQLWYLIGMSTLYTEENIGTIRFYDLIEQLLSGAILPLFFFPAWIRSISSFLPFQYMLYAPIQALITPFSWTTILTQFVISAVWVCLLTIVIYGVFRHGWSRFTAHGV